MGVFISLVWSSRQEHLKGSKKPGMFLIDDNENLFHFMEKSDSVKAGSTGSVDFVLRA
jgi:hypothetical protein